MTLTEFLLARISEDEAEVEDSRHDEHTLDEDGDQIGRGFGKYGLARGNFHEMGCYYYSADLDPPSCDCDGWRRRLAECESKRLIVELHHPDRQLENWYWLQRKCAECGKTWHEWLSDREPTDIGPEQGCTTIQALAVPYSTHPDFNPSWAVKARTKR